MNLQKFFFFSSNHHFVKLFLSKEHEEEDRRELQKLLSQDKSEKDTKPISATPKQSKNCWVDLILLMCLYLLYN